MSGLEPQPTVDGALLSVKVPQIKNLRLLDPKPKNPKLCTVASLSAFM